MYICINLCSNLCSNLSLNQCMNICFNLCISFLLLYVCINICFNLCLYLCIKILNIVHTYNHKSVLRSRLLLKYMHTIIIKIPMWFHYAAVAQFFEGKSPVLTAFRVYHLLKLYVFDFFLLLHTIIFMQPKIIKNAQFTFSHEFNTRN